MTLFTRYYAEVTKVHELYPRKAHSIVVEALADTRVVIVNGARQAGKSTLAAAVISAAPNGTARYLDDYAMRQAALTDPTGFVRHQGIMLIDEVQRAADLILAIKHQVDQDPRPGQFLLTGSAQLLALRDLPDALPGRSETIQLWPLSQGEIDAQPDRFIDAAFRHGSDLVLTDDITKRVIIERALRGGFPTALQRPDPRRRSRFYESYVADLINRDMRQLSDVERPSSLRRLLATIAAAPASLLVVQRLASQLGIPASTTKRYLALLEQVFLTHTVAAWTSGLTARAVATPKLLVTDTGLAGHLAGWSVAKALNPTAPIGPMVENFVLSELARQLTWNDELATLYHFRSKDGVEVDAVLESASGEIIGIEVKAAESVRRDDFNGLRYLADRLGDRFRAGYVMYCGGETLQFGEHMTAIPLSALWRTEP